jgi:pilus assembly protein CpaC
MPTTLTPSEAERLPTGGALARAAAPRLPARSRAAASFLLVAMMAAMSAATMPARAAELDANAPVIYGNDAGMRFIPLGIGKSVIIELPQDAKDVLVANTTIANAIVRTARRAYLIGLAVGQTNVFFFDAEGRQIAGFDIAVTRDLNGVRGAVRQVLPQADIKIEGVADGVTLTGSVANPAESQQAFDIATRLVGEGKVVNGLTIRGRDQVMLRVTVAEVQRDVLKQLGVNINGTLSYGTAVVDFNTTNPFSVTGEAPPSVINSQGATNPLTAGTGFGRVGATVRAMERAGVVRTLAEPNLTAISGESATFLAGGEFPVLAGYNCDPITRVCTQTVTYKKFGIGLNFTPVVMAEGRISLKVATEVSELSSEGALTIGNSGVALPSIKTRRAETTLEIPSGGSMAMAGMIQEQTKTAINGFPGLMQLPVLGALFKSRDYVNRQTELMVLVTPYIVRAVAQKELSRPDDGFVDSSDPAAVLLGRLNRIYGVAGKREQPRRAYHGSYGFILD